MAVRFAPSPTGRFHVGNLRTAWVSWRWARTLGRPWIVRFEDIDGPRVVPGARETQLADMAAIGCVPDLVRIQSERISRYFEFVHELWRRDDVYPCFCSRAEVAAHLAGLASAPHARPPLYDGRCRHLSVAKRQSLAASNPKVGWRLRSRLSAEGFHDLPLARSRYGEAGPVLADFVPSYNLACGLDDLEEGYDLVVRAWDLEEALKDQRQIADFLEGKPRLPAVFHASLVVHNDGRRLEKRSRGVTWPELSASGWTGGRLLERFEASVAETSFVPAEAAVGGERRRTLSLADLGI